MNGAPRIQGKVGQADSPPEMAGKWFFELWLTAVGAGDKRMSLGQFGPFESESKAKSELRAAARLSCEAIEKNLTGEVSGKYIDMNTNATRHWDEH